MSQKNNTTGLTSAIIFTAIMLSGSLIFFGLQIKGNVSKNEAIDIPLEIEKGIEDYINKQQDAERAAQAKQQEDTQKKVKNVKTVSKTKDHIRGNPDAEFSLIEYSDFECPYCKRFHPTAQKIVDEYDGKVNWVYRHFPLGFHDPLATQKAEASECANQVGGNDKFWEYTDMLYEETIKDEALLITKANEIGIDEIAFLDCLESDTYLDHIKQDMNEGASAGITGTPGNIVRNNKTGEVKLVSGAQPFENFKRIIDEMTE